MRLTVLGCSGSLAGPDSPASGYLLTVPGGQPVVMDFGPGVLGSLQQHADPNEVAVMLGFPSKPAASNARCSGFTSSALLPA